MNQCQIHVLNGCRHILAEDDKHYNTSDAFVSIATVDN